MIRCMLLVVTWGWLVGTLRADLSSARQAQDMLGPEVWSRILEIENNQPGRYPARLYATVFEFDGVLWFYTGSEGTQSLSLRLGRAEQDRKALKPLLVALHAGFVAFRELPDRPRDPTGHAARLPNGCFIESLCELRRRLASGMSIDQAQLLAIYLEYPGQGRVGHTGLVFEAGGERFFWDPNRPLQRRRLADGDATAIEVAQTLLPAAAPLASARFWTISERELDRQLLAARTDRTSLLARSRT